MADEAVIAARGWVFLGDPDTGAPTADTLAAFNPASPEVAGFEWVSSTSKENVVNFVKEGGEVTVLDTWDTPAYRSTKSDEKWTVNFSSVAITKETLSRAFPSGKWNEEGSRYDVGAKSSTATKAVLIVIKDEVNGYVGVYFPRGTLSLGDVPVVNTEGFMEVPLTVQALTSSKADLLMSWILPDNLAGEEAVSGDDDEDAGA